jgi:hypothetical protein
MPIFLHTSGTGVSVSACLKAKAICSAVYLDFFRGRSSLKHINHPTRLAFRLAQFSGRLSKGYKKLQKKKDKESNI